MPSPRFTVRLHPALAARVQERLCTTGLSFTALIREALDAYLADRMPTPADRAADTSADTRADRVPTGADTLPTLTTQMAMLTQRVEALEQALTGRRQDADRGADSCADRSADTSADTAADRDADTVLTGTPTRSPQDALGATQTPRRPRRPPSPGRPPERPGEGTLPPAPEVPPFDTTRHVLGPLCPRGHDYHGTGQTLRRLPRHTCLECDAEQARARRRARRQPPGGT
jgi:Ribbon-helix-helix protein, copG family